MTEEFKNMSLEGNFSTVSPEKIIGQAPRFVKNR
jgi:hypothetical protein